MKRIKQDDAQTSKIESRATAVLLRGAEVDGRPALSLDPMATNPASKHSPAPDRCTGTMKNGKPCGIRKTIPTVAGPRCRWHRTPDLEPEQPSTPPVKQIRTRADASQYTAWVLDMGARNRLRAAQVTALLKAVAQWERVQQRAEKDLFDEVGGLLADLKKLRKVFDEAIADLPDHTDRGERIAERVEQQVAELKVDLDARFARIAALQEPTDDARPA